MIASPPTSQWVVGWGASPQDALTTSTNSGGSEQSFRFIVVPTIGGNRERVRFSNYFGATAITIGSARPGYRFQAQVRQSIPHTMHR
ncbi:MAG: hypothetical protein WDN23_07610 [Edaphobacter sp.]